MTKAPILMRLMRCTTLVAGLWLIGLAAGAQESGRWLLPGGEVSLQHSFDRTETGLSMTPRVEYFLSDRWSLGAIKVMEFSFQSDLILVGLLPSTRYYFSGTDRKLQWFGTLAVGPLATFFDDGTSWGGAVLAGAGANFFFTPGAAGELALNYASGFGFGGVDGTAQLSLGFAFQGFLNQQETDTDQPSAPLGRGTWAVGNTSVRLVILEEGSLTPVLELRPDALWFAGRRFALGGALPLTLREHFLEAGLFPAIRFYGAAPTTAWQWFLGLSGGYAHGRELGDRERELRSNRWQVQPEVGLDYFLNPSLALEGRLGYRFLESSLEHSGSLGDFSFDGVSSDLFLEVGLQVFLRRQP